MNRLIYDYLYSKNISEENFKSSSELGIDVVIEVIFELLKIIDNLGTEQGNGVNFLGSGQVVGKGNYCSCFNCRIKAVKELSIISTLYSDEIWLHNPFEKYLDIDDPDLMIENLTIDIEILFELKPLVEANLIKFVKSKIYLHDTCFEKYIGISIDDHKKKYQNLRKGLEDLIISNSTFKAHRYSNSHEAILIESKIDGICVEGNFQSVGFRKYNPIPDLFKKALSRKTKRFFKKEVKESKMSNLIIDRIVKELAFQETYSAVYDLNILTTKNLDKRVLDIIGMGFPESRKADRFIQFSLPYFKNTDIKSLVKLRDQEGLAFMNFRNSMLDLISNHKGMNNLELKDYMDDIIRGNLNEIEKSVGQNKKFLKSEIGKNILMGGSVITLVSATGMIPAAMKATLLALGAFNSSKEFIENAKRMLWGEHGQEDKNFYFIYKSTN